MTRWMILVSLFSALSAPSYANSTAVIAEVVKRYNAMPDRVKGIQEALQNAPEKDQEFFKSFVEKSKITELPQIEWDKKRTVEIPYNARRLDLEMVDIGHGLCKINGRDFREGSYLSLEAKGRAIQRVIKPSVGTDEKVFTAVMLGVFVLTRGKYAWTAVASEAEGCLKEIETLKVLKDPEEIKQKVASLGFDMKFKKTLENLNSSNEKILSECPKSGPLCEVSKRLKACEEKRLKEFERIAPEGGKTVNFKRPTDPDGRYDIKSLDIKPIGKT